MFRSAVGKVMWVGRVTVFLMGLAVILALVFGVASMAFARDGQLFVLGERNVAQSLSALAKQGAGPVLSLKVDSGPPLVVNTSTKVSKLNADKIDGKNSRALMPAQTYVVEHEEVIEPPVIGRSKAILCEEGDVPISVGFGGLDPETQIISSERIVLSDRDAWLVAVRTSESDTYTVQAVCADFPPTHE
jgi:hypothetical protein